MEISPSKSTSCSSELLHLGLFRRGDHVEHMLSTSCSIRCILDRCELRGLIRHHDLLATAGDICDDRSDFTLAVTDSLLLALIAMRVKTVFGESLSQCDSTIGITTLIDCLYGHRQDLRVLRSTPLKELPTHTFGHLVCEAGRDILVAEAIPTGINLGPCSLHVCPVLTIAH